jgi:Type VI secretion system/phage-baseplate injector OB domain
MDNIFKALANAERLGSEMSRLVGTMPGCQLAIVTDRIDPLSLGRVKATVASKCARTDTDWLYRIEPMPALSLPVPRVGDTVMVTYQDGDPHKGFYCGVIQNLLNPAGLVDDLTLQVGAVLIVIKPDGTLEISGIQSLKVSGVNVAFSDCQSFKINDKEVATLDAEDSDGDQLVTKGWVPA